MNANTENADYATEDTNAELDFAWNSFDAQVRRAAQ